MTTSSLTAPRLAAMFVARAHSHAEETTEQALTAIRAGKYAYAATLLRGAADYCEAAQRVTSGGESVAVQDSTEGETP